MNMQHMDMNGPGGMVPLRFPLPVPAGQAFSEFNHHLAGLAVLLVGIAGILLYAQPRRFAWMKLVWPMSLLLLGVYLILYSDPPQWPTGYMSLGASLRDPETFQHKIYALLLIMMGLVEGARALGVAKSPNWRYVFPALAFIGAIYLLFHKHVIAPAAGTHGMAGMPGMSEGVHHLVKMQHMLYLGLGVGIVATKVLEDARKLGDRWGGYVWPALTMLLGIALMLYTE